MIVVSISCITYNHAPYIRECLEGFLMQDCDFEYEILIHDDASTDGTQEIIEEYVQKYPDLIKPIYQTENQWSKEIRPTFSFNLPRAKGKYIALCEGDDYWTDPLKLQKQVDFLENNSDCSMCYHSVRNIFMTEGKKDIIVGYETVNNVKFTSEEFIKRHYARTVSLLFKTTILLNYPKWTFESPIGDYPLQMVCALHGAVGYIGGDPMAVYRVGVPGSTNDGRFGTNDEQKAWIIRRLKNFKKSRDLFNRNSSFKYDAIIQGHKYWFSFTMLSAGLYKFNRLEMLKLYIEYIPYPLKANRDHFIFAIRFLLGPTLYNRIKKGKNKNND